MPVEYYTEVGGGPNVEQKLCVTDYRCLRCFLWSGEIAQVLQVNYVAGFLRVVCRKESYHALTNE